jgi:hypothetical protein
MVTYATSHDSYNLAIASQFGGKEDNGDKDEKWTKHIHEVWNEIQVVVKDNLPDTHLILKKVIHLFC